MIKNVGIPANFVKFSCNERELFLTGKIDQLINLIYYGIQNILAATNKCFFTDRKQLRQSVKKKVNIELGKYTHSHHFDGHCFRQKD